MAHEGVRKDAASTSKDVELDGAHEEVTRCENGGDRYIHDGDLAHSNAGPDAVLEGLEMDMN